MAPKNHEDSSQKTRRSPDFRYYPSDNIAIGVGLSEVKIIFGVTELDGSKTELTAIQVSHRTASQLRDMLTRALKEFDEKKEHASGA